MAETMNLTVNDSYRKVSDILTRLTLDFKAAVEQAHDNETRQYAFSLAHLTRDITQTLVKGVWSTPEEAAEAAMSHITAKTKNNPGSVPDWLRLIVARETSS